MTHDPAKRARNLSKHNIDLPRCIQAFDGLMLTREDDRDNYGEQRLISLGMAHGTVVVLVWTDREDGPRLISCREARLYEQEAYYREYPQS
ncbi:MAG: BrnT family toxin [Gammaproteobacteria bacterium]|nr:BrnT family toxin [Gammaproteobacteria bacterium]